jgi:hypothetical protein
MMTDETNSIQNEHDINPLEPEHVSTEGFNTAENALANTVIERIKTPGTTSRVNLNDGTRFDFRVDEAGQVVDEKGDIFEIEADPEHPIAHLTQEVEELDENNNKTKKRVVIGVLTIAAMIAGISAAKYMNLKSSKE